MSEVNVYMSDNNDELDYMQLLKNVQLVKPEPDLDCGNDSSSVNPSQVLLFRTVVPLTDELLIGTGLALNEGSN